MGRGRSKISTNAASNATASSTSSQRQDLAEAFAPGKDYEAVGGVNHSTRTVSRTTQAEWDAYASKFGADISGADEAKLFKDYDGKGLYGYFRTTNSMAINSQFCKNPGKSPDQIFDKDSKQGRRDLETIDALDRAINSHTTPSDGAYVRYCRPDSLKRSYGLSDAQMNMLLQAPNMSQSQLAQLNTALKGSKSSSAGYTSVSANRSLNAFSNPSNVQSKGYTIERRISVKAGTNAYAPKRNAQESEVVFGRGFTTNFSHVTVEGNHIVIHEYN